MDLFVKLRGQEEWRWAHNPKIPGSKPGEARFFYFKIKNLNISIIDYFCRVVLKSKIAI